LSHFEKLYGHAHDYSTLHVFGCTYFVLKPHVKNYKPSLLCESFWDMVLVKKGYHCFDPVSQKLYVSRHAMFLEYISFFSIPASSHYLTTFDVIKIDPFDIDDIIPTYVPTS